MTTLRAAYECDMHCHTNRSDGSSTPKELFDEAAEAGLKVFAITDHDISPPETVSMDDGSEMPCAEYAEKLGLKYIPGYEFSCDTYVDDVHICGYQMDWNHPDIIQEMQLCVDSKSDGYRKLCEVLTEKGMPIDWEDDILNYTALDGTKQHRSKDEVQRKHIFETMEKKGYCSNWSDAKIMVRDNPELNVMRRKIDPTEAIKLIHRSGGVAILAHPYLIDEKVKVAGIEELTREEYIERLIEAGLDGIEASYPYNKTSYKGIMSVEEIEGEVRRKYASRLLISGGSDYHADHKKKSKKCRYLGERGVSMVEFIKLNI